LFGVETILQNDKAGLQSFQTNLFCLKAVLFSRFVAQSKLQHVFSKIIIAFGFNHTARKRDCRSSYARIALVQMRSLIIRSKYD
jgi:hypothetical protein